MTRKWHIIDGDIVVMKYDTEEECSAYIHGQARGRGKAKEEMDRVVELLEENPFLFGALRQFMRIHDVIVDM